MAAVENLRLVLIGKPGSGHRGHGMRLARTFRLPMVTQGVLVRRAIINNSELAEKVRSLTASDQPLGDDLMAALMAERLAGRECRRGFVLIGMPRSAGQAEALDRILETAGQKLDCVFELSMSDAVLVARAGGWRYCPRDGRRFHMELQPPLLQDICDECGSPLARLQRDRREAVQERADNFGCQVAPVLAHYRARDLVATVDASGTGDDVAQRIAAALATRLGARC